MPDWWPRECGRKKSKPNNEWHPDPERGKYVIISVSVCLLMWLCTRVWKFLFMYLCVYKHMHVCICVHLHMCVYICACIVCVAVCKHVDVHIRICTYTLCACKYEPCTMSACDYVTALCMWVFVGISMYTHIYVYSYCVSIYTWVNVCTMSCTCEYVSLLCMCMILCIRVCMWAYVGICAFTCTCVSGKRLTAQLALLVWPVASCRVINEKGEKQSVFSACIFPFFVFIKRWLLILEVEHCHKKPFAVNKAVAAAWGVNRRPGKPCENHLSATFTKWVRRKGKMGHPGSSILVPHTGQGSPFPGWGSRVDVHSCWGTGQLCGPQLGSSPPCLQL